MTDGETKVTDLEKTESNKAIVKNFSETILIKGDFSKISNFIIGGKDYIQHNPMIGDGIEALGPAFAALAKEGKAIKYTKIHKILGEGNFVLVMAEGKFGKNHSAFYDLFRLDKGKIIEHWDVISEIPAKMAHKNGKF